MTIGSRFAEGRSTRSSARPSERHCPDLSVTIEVAGVTYGPSPVINNHYDPIWDYTFSRPIRWKLGDPVTIKVVDHGACSESTIVILHSKKGDPLAIRNLSDTIKSTKGGTSTLVFASDFKIPRSFPGRSEPAIVLTTMTFDSNNWSTAASRSGTGAMTSWPSRPGWGRVGVGSPRGLPRFGEAPPGVAPLPSLFALRLPSGPWAVVGAWSPGSDDRGRPGALAFHALIVAERDYRRGGSDPFAYAGAHRRDWSAGSTLGPLNWKVEPRPGVHAGRPPSPPAVEALTKGRKVAVESATPIDGFARSVWLGLRRRSGRNPRWPPGRSGSTNGFDLVAIPRLSAVELDSSYLFDLDSEIPEPPRASRGLPAAGRVALTLSVALAAFWPGGAGSVPGLRTIRPTRPSPPPAPFAAIDEAGRSRVMAGLLDLADRFEAFEVGTSETPAGLIVRFSERVRYRGPILGRGAGRAPGGHHPDRDRALAWHDRIRTFVADRPGPPIRPAPAWLDNWDGSPDRTISSRRRDRDHPHVPGRCSVAVRPDLAEPARFAVSGLERLRPVPGQASSDRGADR